MLKIALLIAASFVVVVNGQAYRCEAPSYFETQFLRYDSKDSFYRLGVYYYDRVGERGRVIEKTAENQTRPAVDILVLHKERKEFTVDLKTRKCTVKAPDHEFSPIGVSEDDHFLTNVIIGTYPDDGVELTVWGQEINANGVKGHSVREFTKRDCLPVYTSFFGTVNGTTYDYRHEYYDMVTQMTNPNIFDIPKECLMN